MTLLLHPVFFFSFVCILLFYVCPKLGIVWECNSKILILILWHCFRKLYNAFSSVWSSVSPSLHPHPHLLDDNYMKRTVDLPDIVARILQLLINMRNIHRAFYPHNGINSLISLCEAMTCIQSYWTIIHTNVFKSFSFPAGDPVFENLPATVSIKENEPAGIHVYTVVAKDALPWNPIGSPTLKYSISAMAPAGPFVINEDTGRLTCNYTNSELTVRRWGHGAFNIRLRGTGRTYHGPFEHTQKVKYTSLSQQKKNGQLERNMHTRNSNSNVSTFFYWIKKCPTKIRNTNDVATMQVWLQQLLAWISSQSYST